MRKPGISPQYSLKTGGRKPCTIATIRHARALFPASDENGHAISGPALTTATALAAFLVDRHFFPVPNPAPLFVCIVALAASVSGIASGLASAVIAVTASALLFLNQRAAPGNDTSHLAHMLLLAATAGGTALIT